MANKPSYCSLIVISKTVYVHFYFLFLLTAAVGCQLLIRLDYIVYDVVGHFACTLNVHFDTLFRAILFFVCVLLFNNKTVFSYPIIIMSVIYFFCLSVCPVRQVIPIIRSNDTKGTPDIRTKRSADGEGEHLGNPTFFQVPEQALRTYRAAKRVRKDVLQSRILAKRLRFLRAVGLREIERKMAKRRKRAVVPRVSYPVRIDQVTKKKISFVPRYFVTFFMVQCSSSWLLGQQRIIILRILTIISVWQKI